MEPRLGSRGKAMAAVAAPKIEYASMEPRLGSRGKCWSKRLADSGFNASMEPRLGSRGKGPVGSNEAGE